MKIFLIGYMGCGKTTLGKQLAKRLEIPFIDLDKVIEEKEGQDIWTIFQTQGEAYFRGQEKKYLGQLIADDSEALVAVGGGTPCFYDNMQVMNQKGLTVYLKMDPSSLAYRIFHGKGKRPLVDGKSEDELKEFVKSHLKEREDMYEEAQVIVQALGFNGKKQDELVEVLRSYSK